MTKAEQAKQTEPEPVKTMTIAYLAIKRRPDGTARIMTAPVAPGFDPSAARGALDRFVSNEKGWKGYDLSLSEQGVPTCTKL